MKSNRTKIYAQCRRLACVGLLVLTPFSTALGDSPPAEYEIVGDIGALAKSGEVVLTRSTEVLASSEDIARVALEDGKFVIRGNFDHGGRVNLGVYDIEETFMGSAQFILEPVEIQVAYANKTSGLEVRGGPYNQKLIESWARSEEYLEAKTAYAEVMDAKRGLKEGDEGFQELMDLAWERYRALHEVRRQALFVIAKTDDDPLARLYAVELGAIGSEEALALLDELHDSLGDHPVLVATRNRRLKGIEMSATARAITDGSKVEDFSSVGIDGETYRLQDALDNNKYVLVEFWASWCGPCRATNPELIASYETYGERGFEVFAFSLDEDRDDWVEASIEDEIPWINTSDLKAYDSSVPTQFGVLAIPMNYLVDNQGVIVAKNLRGQDLDEKLIELFD